MPYKKYDVRDTDEFSASHFPEIGADIASIRKEMHKHAHRLNANVLISFVKDGSMKEEWTNANPGIAEMIISKTLRIGNMEALFSNSKNNPGFQTQLEEYIIASFKPSTIVF